ncbi:Cys-tRNA(Pro)/Cys-tRNA(Cys) deacylase YbaK [subsurface metagenome]
MKKTNASRILDKLKIPYEILEYEVDETDLSAENAAQKMGQPLKQVFKTLVIRGDRTGILVTCIPGGAELNLKALASISGNKKVEMIHLKEIKSLTGYIRGGVSPLAMKKNYPTYIDENAFQFPFIIFSAGVRGLQLKVDPNDLLKAIQLISGKLTMR